MLDTGRDSSTNELIAWMQQFFTKFIIKNFAHFLHPIPVGSRWIGMGLTLPHLTMKNTVKLPAPRGHFIMRYLVLGAASVITSQAAVTITSSFNLDSGTNLYTYSYSVENTGPQDLGLVSIPVSTAANVFGISPPTGFSLTFDSVQGLISLFEDNDIFTEQSFAVGTINSPFRFTSALAPGSVTYTAFDVGGDEFTGSVIAPIPEPSALILAGITFLAASAHRRRYSQHA